jgi:uncharacterized protein YggE
VLARPDQAQIDIGVVTSADTAAAAASLNASRADAVVAELKRLVGTRGEIKTARYSVTPNYRYPKEGGKPTIAGYTVSNVVQVKTGELAEVGKILDAVTQSGANALERLLFTVKDDRPLQAEALRQAAVAARAKADAIAAALGVKVVKILAVEEAGAPVRPMVERTFAMRAQAAAAPTPVEPGTLEVRASVTLTAAIAP